MKIIIWSLTVSLALGLCSPPGLNQDAFAADIVTNTSTTQNPSGTVNSPTVVVPTQTQAQENTQKENTDGANQASSLGTMAIAAGAAMMAAGAAMMANPPTAPAGAALMAAGAAMLLSGMQAMQAAGKMAKNANKAGYNANTMQDLTKSTPGMGNTGSVKIDPSLARDPKAAQIFDDLKQKTGLTAEDLANGLNNGKSIGDLLAGKTGVSADKLDGMVASATPLSSADAMSKLGLSAEDLAAMAKNNSMGEDANAYAQGAGSGSGSGRSTASNPLDGMFGAGKDGGAAVVGGIGLDGKLSPEVQAALDKNGITSRTIFEMVTTQYKKKTPMMFGIQQKTSPVGGGDSPFTNLKGTGLDI